MQPGRIDALAAFVAVREHAYQALVLTTGEIVLHFAYLIGRL